MTKIIGLRGQSGAGKDTVMQMMLPVLTAHYSEISIRRFAHMPKLAISNLLSIPYNDLNKQEIKSSVRYGHTVREWIQAFCDMARGLHNPIFVETLDVSGELVIIPDVRNQMESKFIKKNDGVIVDILGRVGDDDNHSSNTIDSVVAYDFRIVNNGDFIHLAKQVMDMILSIGIVPKK